MITVGEFIALLQRHPEHYYLFLHDAYQGITHEFTSISAQHVESDPHWHEGSHKIIHEAEQPNALVISYDYL